MHEMAIVNNLLNECEKIRLENKAKKITRIKIGLGRLSGVEKHYLKEAFNAFASDENASYFGAYLEIIQKDLELKCLDCGIVFVQDKNEFLCKNCASKRLEILSGEELILEQIELV